MKFTIKKKNGAWCIYKNGVKIDEETSKLKAEDAVEFYKKYYKGNVNNEEAHERFQKEVMHVNKINYNIY